MYTLKDYFQEAGVASPPAEAGQIVMPYPPYPHQVSGLRTLLKWNRVGLYDDAGTGKTLPLQAYAALFALLGNKVIVCMPPALIGQFQETYEDFMVGLTDYVKVAPFKGTVKQRQKLWGEWDTRQWPEILLMTYQMFSSLHRLKKKADKKITRQDGGSYIKSGWDKDKQHQLKVKGYNVLVMDESEAVKTISSATTRITRRFVEDDDCNLILSTGSPLGNTPEDCYAPVKLLTPKVYATKAAFERQHIVRNIHSPFKEIVDFINLDALHINVFKHARRVTKEEVNKNLPEKLVSSVPVKLEVAHRKLYRELLTTRILEFDGKVLDATNNSRLRMTALQLISNPNHYLDEGKSVINAMDDAFSELVASIDPMQHKIIVFSNFRATIARLKEAYSKYNPATINSDTRDSNAERVRFVEDDDCRIIFLNYQAGGVGLNLQVSSHVIMFEPTSVPGRFHQAVARSHRAGQKALCVNVYLLRPEHTLAAKQIRDLLDKDEVAHKVVRDPVKMLKELLDEAA